MGRGAKGNVRGGHLNVAITIRRIFTTRQGGSSKGQKVRAIGGSGRDGFHALDEGLERHSLEHSNDIPLSKGDRPMKKILPALVGMSLSFGPIFMVISSGNYGMTVVGAVGLAAGLVWMFKTIMRQQQEILKLGQLLASGSSEHE